MRVCNEIDQSGAGGTPDDYAFIKAILQDVVVDAMFQVNQLVMFDFSQQLWVRSPVLLYIFAVTLILCFYNCLSSKFYG